MRANREWGEHGTENASSCSGPNGEAQAKLVEAGLCVQCRGPFERDPAKAHWKRPQFRCSDCCLAKKARTSKVAS